jgi:hypothetical protein
MVSTETIGDEHRTGTHGVDAVKRIQIDPRSTIAAQLQADVIALQSADELSVGAATDAIVLALARLEACIFGELDDPSIIES